MPDVFRSFIAIDIDNEEILRRLMEAQESLVKTGARIKSIKQQNIHITIRFLGNIYPEMIDKVYNHMEMVSFIPFNARIQGAGAFPTSKYARIVWAGIQEGAEKMRSISEQLEPPLQKMGFKPNSRGFSPHITISRVRADHNKAELIRCIKDLANYEFGILKVCCVKLKKSVLTPSGPIYSTLKEVCRGQ